MTNVLHPFYSFTLNQVMEDGKKTEHEAVSRIQRAHSSRAKREVSAGGVIFHKMMCFPYEPPTKVGGFLKHSITKTSCISSSHLSARFSKSSLITSRTKSGEQFRILLIKDSYGRWALPKGHVGDTIKGETTEQAALRECSEETGIPESDLKIVEKLGDIKYFYQLKGERIFKIVTFFLIESSSDKLKPQWEVKDAKWFEPDEAIEKNEYENSREIVRKAVEKVRGHLKDV